MFRTFVFVFPLILSFSAPGCGDVAPDRSRLVGGQRVTIFDDRATAVEVDTLKGEGMGGDNFTFVRIGSPALVMGDPGDESDPSRKVRVSILGGPDQGLSARIPRKNLRP